MSQLTVFDVSVSDGVTVIQLGEDLYDLLKIALLREQLMEFVTKENPDKVLVNFDRVKMFGSEAMGVLIDATKRVRDEGGDVRLCSMSDKIEQVFRVVALIPKVFTLYRSSGEGISSYE